MQPEEQYFGIHEDYHREVPAAGPSDRAFGLTLTAFLLLVGAWPLVKQGQPRVSILIVGILFGLAAMLRPAWLHRPNRVWTRLGIVAAGIVQPVVTGIMFYLVITPVALLRRLLGHDPLHLQPKPDASSYWLPRQPPGPSAKSMPHQF